MATLKELRYDRALSQRDLAKLSGVALATINRLETHQHKPTHQTRRKLAKALKVKPNEIEY